MYDPEPLGAIAKDHSGGCGCGCAGGGGCGPSWRLLPASTTVPLLGPAAPPAGCGDAYRFLVTNAAGYTAKNPCGPYCNDADHGLWNTAAKALLTERVEPAIADYKRAGGADAALLRRFEAYGESTFDLPTPTGWALPGEQAKQVAKAIENMNIGVCVLEQALVETAKLGVTPSPVPGVTPPRPATPAGIPSELLFLGLIALVGGFAYTTTERRR